MKQQLKHGDRWQCIVHLEEIMKRHLASIKGRNLSSALATFTVMEYRSSVSRTPVFQEKAEIQTFM